MKELLNRISADPNVCFGRPCIKGTRVWVSLILDMLSDGMTPEEILKNHPQLQPDDVRAAAAYGAEAAREKLVDLPQKVLA